MRFWVLNIRFYIVLFTLLLSVFFYEWVIFTTPSGTLQVIRLGQFFALTSVTYLYVALLASPLTKAFPWLPFRVHYIKARRAIGVSAFYFGFLHGFSTFFWQLGGFNGLGFLSTRYLVAISLSFTALVILFLMSLTSFDWAIKKMGSKNWKRLHRLVYIAVVFILIHALMLGTHFSDLSTEIPRIFFVAFAVLLLLEALRFDKYLRSKFLQLPNFGISAVLSCAFIAGVAFLFFLPEDVPLSFNIHSAHLKLAQDAQQNTTNTSNIPGLNGDRNLRFTVSFKHPDKPLANTDVPLNFQVFSANNGNQIFFFTPIYQWLLHLMIVDTQLTHFEHIHPTLSSKGFDIATKFPHDGTYHLYVDFLPTGAIEQQMAFTLPVGGQVNEDQSRSTQPVDTNFTKTFGDYEVTLDTHGTLRASEMTLGKNTLTFTIKDAKTKMPITTLKPFMGAFGHLTMINQKTYDFIHVHPTNLTIPAPDANGGPSVDFVPIGIYGPFKPGIYRAFGEFSTKVGEDFDVDFTVEVK